MRLLLAAFAACLLLGCAHEGRGRLLIIGGALSPENAPVYRALERERGERLDIVVLPTASGIPEDSGPGTAMDLHANLTSPRIIVIDPRTAPMADVVRAIDGADAVWFTGGDQSRITEHMLGTPAHEACFRLLERGGTIAGTSAGAAMMGEVMITGGRGDGVTTAPGMGFLPGVLTDQHFEARGREDRLVAAMRREGVAIGVGVNENRAVVMDLRSGRVMALGDAACVVVRTDADVASTRRLSEGEGIDLPAGARR